MASVKHSLLGLEQAARLKEIEDKWTQFPGRAPNGTGLTGLTPSDAKGYSDMLNEQTEGMNLENAAAGQAPVRVRYGGEYASQGHGIASDPTSSFNTAEGPYGGFGAGTGGQSGQLDMLNPTHRLAGLSGGKPMAETYDEFIARTRKPKPGV